MNTQTALRPAIAAIAAVLVAWAPPASASGPEGDSPKKYTILLRPDDDSYSRVVTNIIISNYSYRVDAVSRAKTDNWMTGFDARLACYLMDKQGNYLACYMVADPLSVRGRWAPGDTSRDASVWSFEIPEETFARVHSVKIEMYDVACDSEWDDGGKLLIEMVPKLWKHRDLVMHAFGQAQGFYLDWQSGE